jgi:hypothetical protein
MAVFTRTNGNAQNVVSAGNVAISSEASTVLTPVVTGVGKPLQFFGITSNATAYTAELGTGEVVESILRVLGTQATQIAYQVNTTLLSVAIEESAWNATDLQANIRALGTAVGTNSFNCSGITVTDVGFKLATS